MTIEDEIRSLWIRNKMKRCPRCKRNSIGTISDGKKIAYYHVVAMGCVLAMGKPKLKPMRTKRKYKKND